MRNLVGFWLLFYLFLLCGCYRHAHPHVNYYVPGECKASLSLIDCDYSSPPHCKKAIASYRAGCEQLATK